MAPTEAVDGTGVGLGARRRAGHPRVAPADGREPTGNTCSDEDDHGRRRWVQAGAGEDREGSDGVRGAPACAWEVREDQRGPRENPRMRSKGERNPNPNPSSDTMLDLRKGRG